MNSPRSLIVLACLVAMAATAGAQGLRPRGSGITDIMRAGPRLPQAPAPRAAASGPVGQRAAEYIVALVNSEPVTNTEVQMRVARLLRENPDAAQIPRPELTRLVLERLVSERAQLQLAKELGVKVDEVAIDQAEQTIARQNQITLVELRSRVAAENITPAEFRKDIRDQLLLTRLRDREVESKLKISDADVAQYLQDQRNGNASALGGMINVAQILVAVPENATASQLAALQQKADGIARRARAGEDFSKLAAELSDSPDRDSGGVLGNRNVDRYPPLFAEAVQSTPVNGIAGPVRSGAGFHVLKLLAKSQSNALDAVVAQTEARHILLRTDAKRSTAQAIEQLADFKKRVQGGTADFAVLARDNSQDASAKSGGDLGWTSAGQFVPEFEEAMNRLAPGQISDPVVSRFGVHLIQVVGRRDGKLSQAEQREAVRTTLREQRIDEAFQTWAQEVRARAYVEYRDPPQS